MNKTETKFTTIDQYIKQFPPDVQAKLEKLRVVIQEAAPEATEAIKYMMPTYIYHRNLVHFAAYKNHIGFYPNPSGVAEFAEELSKYVTSKGAIQFPIDKEMPYDLVERIVKHRVKEEDERAKLKQK